MRSKLTILAIVAMMLGGTALAAPTNNYRYDWGPSVSFNTCMEGLIQISGTTHYVYKSESDGAGGFHIKSHTNTKMVGDILTGPYAGAKLTGSRTYNWNYNSMIPGRVYTRTSTYTLNGQGQAPNLKVKIVRHYTVNANGVLTATVSKFETSCK